MAEENLLGNEDSILNTIFNTAKSAFTTIAGFEVDRWQQKRLEDLREAEEGAKQLRIDELSGKYDDRQTFSSDGFLSGNHMIAGGLFGLALVLAVVRFK